MTTQYLLPCSCGAKNVVNNRQAGEAIACVCGKTLEVPTMRGLAALAQVASKPAAGAGKRPWGPRQGLFFVGLILAAGALGYCGYLYWSAPSIDSKRLHAEMAGATIEQAHAWWQHLEAWKPGAPSIDRMMTEYAIMQSRAKMHIALAFGIAALLVAASGLLVRPARR